MTDDTPLTTEDRLEIATRLAQASIALSDELLHYYVHAVQALNVVLREENREEIEVEANAIAGLEVINQHRMVLGDLTTEEIWSSRTEVQAISALAAAHSLARARAEKAEDRVRELEADHEHDFTAGPNCAKCGLHASVVDGGALSPREITKRFKAGAQLRWEGLELGERD